MTSSKLFPNKINKFYLNQEISQYSYKNKLFTKENYLTDILTEYRNLYTDILKPTPLLMKKIADLVNNYDNIIGIHIRCGDCYMVTNSGETYNTNINKNINNKLLKIKKICDIKFNDYNIFLTSDNLKMYDEIIGVFDKSKVIYENSLIQHLDRKSKNSDISKIFIDNYILSQETKTLFITECSNFGRIAALSCKHTNIYDLDCNTLNLSRLVSKHERLFTS